jgi:hypothetical protein
MKSRIEIPDQHPSPIREVSHSVSMLFDNTFELAELQLKLARVDLSIFMRRAMHLAWMLPIAIGLLLAGLPVLGFALAGTLVAAAGITVTSAQWIVGGIFVVLALLLAAVGAIIAMRAGSAFRRSQRELEKNVKWLRQMVVGSEAADYQPPNP